MNQFIDDPKKVREVYKIYILFVSYKYRLVFQTNERSFQNKVSHVAVVDSLPGLPCRYFCKVQLEIFENRNRYIFLLFRKIRHPL